MTSKRILVGMSGGIDSSATCLMLQEQRYEVVGVTMRTWDVKSQFSNPNQEDPDFVLEARALAERLNISHYVADEREAFKKIVVKNFMEEYQQGRTPNPCVICNPLFKFRVLMEYADRYDCDYISTGHYTQLEERKGYTYILTGLDEKKDQSYFLWQLSQEVLKRCIFPLGSYNKQQVRDYLTQKGFATKAKEGESMEICFVENDYRTFLKERFEEEGITISPGKFVSPKGVVLGQHKGVPFYTVGQRKGLDIALGYPAYVVKMNADKNTVMLGTVDDLKTRALLIERPQWVDQEAFWKEQEISVRIRYRSEPIPCRVKQIDDALYLVHLERDASAITPGQSAVFYVGNRVIGGAFIASQRGINMYLYPESVKK
jgi:tRNA-specific 2-thiouridylase